MRFKARTAAHGQTIPPDELDQNRLEQPDLNQLLLAKATDADKAAGKKEADDTSPKWSNSTARRQQWKNN